MNPAHMKASESTEQIKIFQWARMMSIAHPELMLLYHIPNEGKRSRATGARLKAEGLKTGIPDICLPVSRQGYHALYIELKYGSNKATPAQKEMIEALQAAGNFAVVITGAAAAIDMIKWYLEIRD